MLFAVLDNDSSVVNIIVAESQEIAEEVTRSVCVEYTHENPAFIGAILKDGKWVKRESKIQETIEEIE